MPPRAPPASRPPALASTRPASAPAPYEVVLSPAADWLAGPQGERLLELRPELLLALGESARPQSERPPLRVQPVQFGPWQLKQREATRFRLEAHASTGPFRYRLGLAGEPGLLVLDLESEALEPALVRAEVLRLRSPATGAAMVDPSLRWAPLRRESFAGPLDAQQLRLAHGQGELLLEAIDLQGLWLRRVPGGGFLVELELDHEDNHPFRPLLACAGRPGAHLKRGTLDVSVRPAGSRRQARLLLLLGPARLPVLARYPRGARAAFALADHADQSNAAKLEALAFGATGAVEAGRLGPTFPGLVNRGLAYTKSIFLHRVRGYAKQLEEPSYRKLLERMTRSGVELALHSVSGKRDKPREVSKLLPEFRSLSSGRTWIDHQPVTNCEALSNQGWDPRSRYHVLELLTRAGLRHFWTGEDLPTPAGSLNLLWPERPASRRPLVYPFALHPAARAEDELWLFASTPFFLARGEVVDDLAEARLQRLERERGLFIGHVYLDTFHRKGGRFSDRSLLQFGDGPRRYRLRAEVDEVFRRLAAHQASGRLWVTGIDALIDHLRGRASVELRPGPAGEVVVRSRSARPLAGLTLILPPGAGRVSLDQGAVAGQHEEAGEREIWFDLPAGGSRQLRLGGHCPAPAPLVLREAHD